MRWTESIKEAIALSLLKVNKAINNKTIWRTLILILASGMSPEDQLTDDPLAQKTSSYYRPKPQPFQHWLPPDRNLCWTTAWLAKHSCSARILVKVSNTYCHMLGRGMAWGGSSKSSPESQSNCTARPDHSQRSI